jgi:hypothetical protein
VAGPPACPVPQPVRLRQRPGLPPGATPFAVIHEDEGITLVLTQDQADRLGLPYGYVAARITLTIGSELGAVGLTAEVSRVLAAAGISCNVIAGAAHDHLFVDAARGPKPSACWNALVPGQPASLDHRGQPRRRSPRGVGRNPASSSALASGES